MGSGKSIGIGIGVGLLIVLLLAALAYILYLRYRLKFSRAQGPSDPERNDIAAADTPISTQPTSSAKAAIAPKSQAMKKPPLKTQFSNPLVSSSSRDADMGQSRKTSKASETSVNARPVMDVQLQHEAQYVTMTRAASNQDVHKEPIYQNFGDSHYDNLPHGAHSGYTAGEVDEMKHPQRPSTDHNIYEMVPDVGPFLASN